MESLEDKVVSIEVTLAKQTQQERNHQTNIERFWSLNWPSALEKIDKNAADIAQLKMELAKLQTKLLVYGSIFVLGAPIISMFLIEFLKSLLSKEL